METVKTPRLPLDTVPLFSSDVLALTGWSYRMLDYHVRQGYVLDASGAAKGSGSRRVFTLADVARVRLVKQLAELGARTSVIAAVMGQLDPDPEEWPPYLFVTPDGTVRRGLPLPAGCWWLHAGQLRAPELTAAA